MAKVTFFQVQDSERSTSDEQTYVRSKTRRDLVEAGFAPETISKFVIEFADAFDLAQKILGAHRSAGEIVEPTVSLRGRKPAQTESTSDEGKEDGTGGEESQEPTSGSEGVGEVPALSDTDQVAIDEDIEAARSLYEEVTGQRADRRFGVQRLMELIEEHRAA